MLSRADEPHWGDARDTAGEWIRLASEPGRPSPTTWSSSLVGSWQRRSAYERHLSSRSPAEQFRTFGSSNSDCPPARGLHCSSEQTGWGRATSSTELNGVSPARSAFQGYVGRLKESGSTTRRDAKPGRIEVAGRLYRGGRCTYGRRPSGCGGPDRPAEAAVIGPRLGIWGLISGLHIFSARLPAALHQPRSGRTMGGAEGPERELISWRRSGPRCVAVGLRSRLAGGASAKNSRSTRGEGACPMARAGTAAGGSDGCRRGGGGRPI